LEASQHLLFYRIGLLAPRPTPIPEEQASVYISPRGRVATHFSRLLRHAWVTVGLFLFPSPHGEPYFHTQFILYEYDIMVIENTEDISSASHVISNSEDGGRDSLRNFRNLFRT
jgi:hypothetical protein